MLIEGCSIVELLTLSAAQTEGASEPKDPRPPQPDDLATICYTSGTTGLPVLHRLIN